ncbi:RDD family protein [Leptolyngbya sp. FACHB-261]|uniref:RDD family protein n=1 Tax=Leptolyngbya sp. FACHB-261 TaxID=2692806 RepID=UPI0016838D79|nr:RDD family protein [Leptolyngbya sp. FACHB-261]MBD2103110.1 RDD family protein [Leptolyngbya sp. FACHB-261]
MQTQTRVQPNVQVLGRRFGAFVIDAAVLNLLRIVVGNVFGVERFTQGSPWAATVGGAAWFSSSVQLDWPWQLLLLVTYFMLQEALFGATLGKWAVRLRVVDLSGRRVRWLGALGRNLLRPVDYWFALGALVMARSPKRQRLGDYLASTLVVDADSVPQGLCPRAEVRRNRIALLVLMLLFTGFCAGFSYYGRPPLLIRSWANTGQFLFRERVDPYSLGKPSSYRPTSYNLGKPSRGRGSITYPIRYQRTGSNTPCEGKLTLRWMNFWEGWRPESVESTCGQQRNPESF